MTDQQTVETTHFVGPFPRVAWCAEQPGRSVEERLARVALAARAAALPADVLLGAHARTAPWPNGPASLYELRRALADAATLIARAPWWDEGDLVTTTGASGIERVVPFARAGGLGDPVYLHLELATLVGLTDAPVDVRLLPLQLAADGAGSDDQRPDPTVFAFVGTEDTEEGIRLWRYLHRDTGRALVLDADSRPWRPVGTGDWVPWGDTAEAVRTAMRPRRRRPALAA
jgi:hypothetical protein